MKTVILFLCVWLAYRVVRDEIFELLDKIQERKTQRDDYEEANVRFATELYRSHIEQGLRDWEEQHGSTKSEEEKET